VHSNPGQCFCHIGRKIIDMGGKEANGRRGVWIERIVKEDQPEEVGKLSWINGPGQRLKPDSGKTHSDPKHKQQGRMECNERKIVRERGGRTP